MSDVLVLLVVVVAILVYLVVTHKISLASLESSVHGKLDGIVNQLHMTHAAVQAPLQVVTTPIPAPVAPAPAAPVVEAAAPPVLVAAPATTAPISPVIASMLTAGHENDPPAQTATVVVAPPNDRSGFDLGWSNGNPKVNILDANREYVYTVDVPDEYTGSMNVDLIRVAGSPTGPRVMLQILAPNGATVPNTKYEGLMYDEMPTIAEGPLAPGRYQYKMQMNQSGPMAVALYHT